MTEETGIFEWAKENCSITLKDGKLIYQIGELKMVYRYHKVKNVNTFDEVESKYNSIKPLVSINHSKEDDLRPLGVRSRKWERIIKVNANKYILNDGDYDPISFWKWHSDGYAHFIPTAKELEACAPIVWTRKRDGAHRRWTEYVTIRNGSGNGAHTARYTFLENALPRGLKFWVTCGKQYVTTHTEKDIKGREKGDYQYQTALWDTSKAGENRFFLPKSQYNPKYNWKDYPNESDDHYQNKWNKWGSPTDDGVQLVFKRNVNHAGEHLGWELCSNSFIFEAPKKRVDKVGKKDILPYAEEWYDWLTTMIDLIPWKDRKYARKTNEELMQYAIDKGYVDKDTYWLSLDTVPELTKEILRGGAEHPYSMHLAVDFLTNGAGVHYSDTGDAVTIQEYIKYLRVKFNNYVNTRCGLVHTITEKRIVKEKR